MTRKDREQREKDYQERQAVHRCAAVADAFTALDGAVSQAEAAMKVLSRSLRGLKGLVGRLPPSKEAGHLRLRRRAEDLTRVLRKGVLHD